MAAHARRKSKQLFGVSAASLRLLVRSGFVRPDAQSDTGSFAFRELVLLRTVGALFAAQVPSRVIYQTLRQLKPWLSDTLPMSRVSLQVIDDRIAVREGASLWEPASGQYAMPLDQQTPQARSPSMKKHPLRSKPIDTAHDHYLRGADLEEEDALAAKKAYQACLKGDCSHMQARINLGRLLHLEGKHREAESIYRGTAEPDAILFFNLGVVQEDQGRPDDAVAAYRNALVHDPCLADAHFNLALLLERGGETQAAFRHLLAYRRLLPANNAGGR